MGRHPPKKTEESQLVKKGWEPSSEDISALDDFCSDVIFEELEFETWQMVNKHLDIQLVEVLLLEEVAKCSKSVTFTRTFFRAGEDGKAKKKKVAVDISWELPLPPNARIVVSEEGDVRGNQRGDLVVILRVSS